MCITARGAKNLHKMGTSEGNTVISKTEDFININQKIILPENYKKFSTIKLKIKPAKLIFVNSENNSNKENEGVKEDKESDNCTNFKDCHRDFRLDPSFLFSSAECLSGMSDNRVRSKKNCTLNRICCGSDSCENEITDAYSENNGDSEIIKELVLEKFKDLLQRFIERSNRRRIVSTEEEDNLARWTDFAHFLDPLDFQHIAKEFQCTTNENKVTERKNSDRMDISDECHDIPSGQNEEETMLAQNEEKTLKHQEPSQDKSYEKEYHPRYVHISEPLETVQTLQFVGGKPETIDSLSIVTDSSEDELIRHEDNLLDAKLKEDINEQTTAIMQVLKVLSMCETNKKLSESVLRVEAERVLLIATLRKNLLTEELAKSPYYEEQDRNGFVLLSNLRIPIEQINQKNIKQTRFFLCVFRCGSTVLCSDLLMLNSQVELEIDEPFSFEDLPTNFEISVEIYSMHLKIREKSTGRKILKKYRNVLIGLRSRFRNTAEVQQKDEPKTRISAFSLIGRTTITRSNLQSRQFSFDNDNTQNISLEDLKCNIDSGVKLDIFLSGFLMVCESCGGKTRWRRQWCILDASELKFWDYPGKEETAQPNRIIDLSRSLLPSIMLADRKFCSRPRSLHLKIGPDCAQEEFYHKDIFLAADNPRDFLFWEKELNRVLKNLINWGCMKTYFENSL